MVQCISLKLYLGLVLIVSCLFLGRIVGAGFTNIKQYPYVVSISDKNTFISSGVLVNRLYVVTAASGLAYWPDFNDLLVRGNSSEAFAKSAFKRKVLQYFLHPNYTQSNRAFDIAVVRLEAPIPKNSTIKTIPLCTHNLEQNDNLIAVGWSKKNYQQPIREALLTIAAKRNCDSDADKNVADFINCASNFGLGMVGAPMIHNGEVCSLVSAATESKINIGYINMTSPIITQFLNKTMENLDLL